MVIEVTYQTKKDAVDPLAKVLRTEYFESSTMPSKQIIIKKLTDMGADFAEQTVSISEYDKKDAASMRSSGLRVTTI